MQIKYKNLTLLLYFLAFIMIFILIASLFFFFANEGLSKNGNVNTVMDDHSQLTVIIDAGHGGEDGGAIGVNGCFEKDINLSIAQKLREQLTSMGIKSVLTRNEDILLYDRNAEYQGHKKMLDMIARKKIVEGYPNAIFISIHQNKYPVAKYNGFQIYYSQNNSNSKHLSDKIENTVRSLLQVQNNRHSKPSGGNIYMLDKINCPAVLLECGFLSNPEECELLSSESYQKELSLVICSALIEYLSEK